MLEKTKGIVLNHIKYKESSIIVKIFTEHLGTQSFVVNSVRSKKSKGKIALFQPLTILDLVVYYNEKRNIHRLSEYKNLVPFRSIPFDVYKSTIGIFLSEILYKTLLEEEQENILLFEFLSNSIETLDELEDNVENFHLLFLLKLSQYFGLRTNSFSDMQAELIDNSVLSNTEMLNNNEIKKFEELSDFSYLDSISINNFERRKMMNTVLGLYSLHFPSLKNLKSLTVLREVLS